MTTQDLHLLLDDVEDSRELVLARRLGGDVHLAAWRNAAADARVAYARWNAAPGVLARAAYLAAEDQADAALATLWIERAGR